MCAHGAREIGGRSEHEGGAEVGRSIAPVVRDRVDAGSVMQNHFHERVGDEIAHGRNRNRAPTEQSAAFTGKGVTSA